MFSDLSWCVLHAEAGRSIRAAVLWFALTLAGARAGDPDPPVKPAERVPDWRRPVPQVAAQREGLPAPASRETAPPGVMPYVRNRFELGTRMLYAQLQHPRKGEPFDGSFIGSIDRLRMKQDLFPRHLVLHYRLTPAFGLGVQLDRLIVETLTTLPRAALEDGRRTDGDIQMRGWAPFLWVRYPAETKGRFFGEWGILRYRNRFDPHPEWSVGGRRNVFVLEDSTAWHLGLGAEYTWRDRLSMDVYWRYVDVAVDGVYQHRPTRRAPEPFTFDVTHVRIGAGARYRF